MPATEPQPSNGRVAFQQSSFVDVPQDDDLSLRDILKTAWRGRWIISFCVGASLFVGYRQVQQTGDIWRAWSSIYVEGNATQSVLGIDGMIASGTRNFANNQAAVLKSVERLQSVVVRPEVATSSIFEGRANRVGYLRENLSVKVGRDDDLITVSLNATDVDEACVIVNAVVEEYRRFIGTRSESTVKDMLEVLTERRTALETELTAAQTARDEFLDEHSVLALDPDGTGAYEIQQLNAFKTQLTEAKRELAEARSKLRLARAEDLADRPEALLELVSGIRLAPSAAAPAEDPALAAARADLASAEAELQENTRRRKAALTTVTEEHPSVAALDDARADIEARRDAAAATIESLTDAASEADASIRAQDLAAIQGLLYQMVTDAETRVEDAQKNVDDQLVVATRAGELQAQFRRIESSFQQARDRVDEISASIRELDLAEIGKERLSETSVTVLDPARPDTANLANSATRTLAQFFVLGLLAGGALTWLRQMLDRRIRSDEDLNRSIPDSILGVLPAARLRASESNSLRAWEDHDSLAESARGLRTALTFALPPEEGAVLHVTSPDGGEGKSTISSLLAIAIAKAGHSVIIVDADLRSPAQDGHFDLPNEVGLAQALANEATLSEAIQKTELPTLDVMTTGGIPSAPAEMLISPRFDALLGLLAEIYERVIVDSPPVLAVSDSRIIATKCEGTLLVARADTTSRDALAHARERLASVGARIVGCALNAATAKGGYGYGYGYGYGAEHKQAARKSRVRTEPAADPSSMPSAGPVTEAAPQAAPAPEPTPSPEPAPAAEPRRKPQRVEAKPRTAKASGSAGKKRRH